MCGEVERRGREVCGEVCVREREEVLVCEVMREEGIQAHLQYRRAWSRSDEVGLTQT